MEEAQKPEPPLWDREKQWCTRRFSPPPSPLGNIGRWTLALGKGNSECPQCDQLRERSSGFCFSPGEPMQAPVSLASFQYLQLIKCCVLVLSFSGPRFHLSEITPVSSAESGVRKEGQIHGNRNKRMKPYEVKDKKWMLDNGHTVCHVLTENGYRAVDVESGLYLCSNCNDLLNQECQAPNSALCAPCLFQKNSKRLLEDARKLELV